MLITKSFYLEQNNPLSAFSSVIAKSGLEIPKIFIPNIFTSLFVCPPGEGRSQPLVSGPFQGWRGGTPTFGPRSFLGKGYPSLWSEILSRRIGNVLQPLIPGQPAAYGSRSMPLLVRQEDFLVTVFQQWTWLRPTCSTMCEDLIHCQFTAKIQSGGYFLLKFGVF